ncbi:hypothetical protein N474_01980 [Pseudoalteromonas luteoviolacea CPMOR-2]|nr:hypothetical protein N474_01980 [Pseudoalteromonas luteoviolacea CPMOR-2]
MMSANYLKLALIHSHLLSIKKASELIARSITLNHTLLKNLKKYYHLNHKINCRNYTSIKRNNETDSTSFKLPKNNF